MYIIQDNPHLDALISSLYQEAFEGASTKLQIKRATELGMSLDEYQKWIEGFPFLPKSEQQACLSMIVGAHIASSVYSALALRLTTSSASATR